MADDDASPPAVLEPASSGRAKCRACARTIPKGELRFGERAPNPFGEGDATFWFHLRCAAAKRPATFSGLLEQLEDVPSEMTEVRAWADAAVVHERLSWHAHAERAPSGRARCRSCKDLIAKAELRVAIDIWEEGRFAPMGFVHAGCARAHFGDADLLARIRHFSPKLDEAAVDELATALAKPPPPVDE